VLNLVMGMSDKMKKILMLHGINHNMYGKRDPRQYGTTTLQEIEEGMSVLAEELGVEIQFFHSNIEGEAVERVHQAFYDKVDAVIINPGAWTHYSYGLRDALDLLTAPIVEVHMSNIYARESFRHHSIFSDVVKGQINGFGAEAYYLGLRAAVGAIEGRG
jgi:3-dehydroquinate dehydratase-2